MGLNIKNAEVDALVTQVANATGETKTEAIRKALIEKRDRLGLPSVDERVKRLTEILERDVWSKIPEHLRGTTVTKEEYDALFE